MECKAVYDKLMKMTTAATKPDAEGTASASSQRHDHDSVRQITEKSNEDPEGADFLLLRNAASDGSLERRFPAVVARLACGHSQ